MTAPSARALLWVAGALAVLGAVVGSPAGGVLVLVVAALLAAVPAFLGPGRARWVGAMLAVACLALAAAQLPAARQELGRYAAHARR